MLYKISQYIKQEQFFDTQFPVMECYADTSKKKYGFFNKEEQQELFDYFFEQRESNLLYSFTFGNDSTLSETPVFSDIRDNIIEKLHTEIKGLLKIPKPSIEQCFDLLDYINSISQALDQDIIIKY